MQDNSSIVHQGGRKCLDPRFRPSEPLERHHHTCRGRLAVQLGRCAGGLHWVQIGLLERRCAPEGVMKGTVTNSSEAIPTIAWSQWMVEEGMES